MIATGLSLALAVAISAAPGADEHLLAGARAFRDGHFDAALVEFRVAGRAIAHPRHLRHVGGGRRHVLLHRIVHRRVGRIVLRGGRRRLLRVVRPAHSCPHERGEGARAEHPGLHFRFTFHAATCGCCPR